MKSSARRLARQWYEGLKAADQAQWPAISTRMLRQVSRLSLTRELPDIQKTIIALAHPQEQVIEATITSAQPLDEATEQTFLRQLFGRQQVAVTRRVDKALLGGAVVQTGDERWDLSIRHQLRRLSRAIID
ncbi:MAG: F0F1 ATP synthase subunit delta [Parcubacteria group bacterium]|nr:F0F1 ATP synthase subunit delta [Parcubacteria group bacterium]